MEIVIYEALLNSVARAIQEQRPELLAAHTKRYHDKIQFPLNANKPLASNELKNTRAEVDYDIRGSGLQITISPSQVEGDISVDAAVLRSIDAGKEEQRFPLGAALSSSFD